LHPDRVHGARAAIFPDDRGGGMIWLGLGLVIAAILMLGYGVDDRQAR
jgi:hypothetical protein